MQLPITVSFPDRVWGPMVVSHQFPPGCPYKIPFASPMLASFEMGSFLSQSAIGDDYSIDYWWLSVQKDGFAELLISQPVISIVLFLKSSFPDDLSGNGSAYPPAGTFAIFYLPPGSRTMHLPPDDYALLMIIPPVHYLQTMAADHPGVENILHRLAAGDMKGNRLTSFLLPQGAWRLVKKLEQTDKKGVALDLALRRYIMELLGLYYDQYKQHVARNQLYTGSEEKAMAVRNYILEHLGDMALGGLDGLARRFYLSRQTLAKKFKAYTGKTIPQFISDERLEWAKKLLDKKDMPVFEIAWTVGFSDTANFIRSFKRKFGYSPRKQGCQ